MDGWWVMGGLIAGRHRTGRAGSVVVVRIAWRSSETVLLRVHRETGGGGGAAGRGVDGAVGRRGREGGGLVGGGGDDVGTAGFALRAESKISES